MVKSFTVKEGDTQHDYDTVPLKHAENGLVFFPYLNWICSMDHKTCSHRKEIDDASLKLFLNLSSWFQSEWRWF